MATRRVIPGPTPNGGAYAEGFFYTVTASGDRHTADESVATHVETVEFAADGSVLRRTYATLGRLRRPPYR